MLSRGGAGRGLGGGCSSDFQRRPAPFSPPTELVAANFLLEMQPPHPVPRSWQLFRSGQGSWAEAPQFTSSRDWALLAARCPGRGGAGPVPFMPRGATPGLPPVRDENLLPGLHQGIRHGREIPLSVEEPAKAEHRVRVGQPQPRLPPAP